MAIDFTAFNIGDLANLAAVVAGGVGVWVSLNGRLVKLETQSASLEKRIDTDNHALDKRIDTEKSTLEKRMDAEKASIDRRFNEAREERREQFDQIMTQLANIDRKLDAKMDKKTGGN